ncbi:MAG: TonB-dependent receptor plug domain-containing protein, partial [Phenylobacterium sp.]|uniref:TonB-dependent receptor n=1 Tax=Phenylobacterium sp. TaxID=1871053 RepID=UPI002735EF58
MLLAGAAQAEPADTEVGEVIVTALKRSELLSNVGASVTAISSEQLRSTRVEGVGELAGYTPNVDIKSNSPGANVVVTIRGVGIDDFSTTVSPAAGVYVDEVPLSSLALMGLSLFDLERVEVLRGPQGTLYGRNSIAGAINILSARPGSEFGGYVETGYANYDRFELTGAVDLPVSDDLAFRVSGKTVQQAEGYWRSNLLADGTPGSRRIGEQHATALRVQAAYSPTSYLRFNLKLEGERSRSETGPLSFFGSFKMGSPFVLCDPVRADRVDNTQCTDAFGYRNLNAKPEYHGDWIGNFPLRLRQVGGALHTTVDFSGAQLDLI